MSCITSKSAQISFFSTTVLNCLGYRQILNNEKMKPCKKEIVCYEFHVYYFFFSLIIQIVDHVISPNGIAYSGGPSLTGAVAPGHHMEITVLQLYKVALSAGKAHRDHKHHHAHHFDHDGLVTTTPQPTLAPQVVS